MWKKLLGIVQDVFDLRHQVKGHDKRLDELSTSVKGEFKDIHSLSDRVLRLELDLQHRKEQHARELAYLQEHQSTERENFRLQLENLLLRTQRSLPPGETKSPSIDEDGKTGPA